MSEIPSPVTQPGLEPARLCHAGHALNRVTSDGRCWYCRSASKRAGYQRNKAAITATVAAYRDANRARIAERERLKYQADPGLAAARKRETNAAKSEKHKESVRAARRRKRREDPMFNLACALRGSLAKYLARGGFTKKAKSAEVIGCDWPTLKAHIEAQFVAGMSWTNRAQWHVDHRVPLASAKTEAELLTLCHYTNLQPLWWVDNLKKGAHVSLAA